MPTPAQLDPEQRKALIMELLGLSDAGGGAAAPSGPAPVPAAPAPAPIPTPASTPEPKYFDAPVVSTPPVMATPAVQPTPVPAPIPVMESAAPAYASWSSQPASSEPAPARSFAASQVPEAPLPSAVEAESPHNLASDSEPVPYSSRPSDFEEEVIPYSAEVERPSSKKKSAGGGKGGFLTSVFSSHGSTESEELYRKGVASLKDLIAPPAIRMSPSFFHVGSVFARTHFVIAYPKYLGTNWFSPIVNIDAPMDVGFLIHPVDTREIMRELRASETHVRSQIGIEAEGGKVRDPMLEAALENIQDLRDRLQQGTEKFFRFGLYMTVYAADEKALNDISRNIESILEAQLVFTKQAVLRMDQGFISTRPLGMDLLDIANNLNTSPLSTTFPFVSSDLSSNEGILYGINRHNNSLVLFDRFRMENANMVVFAKSGAGKSYTIKLEILRSMMFGTSVVIIDPEQEYKHLCDTVGGTFLDISLASDAHLNPFDLPKIAVTEDEQGVFRSHVANLIGLLHLMLGAVTPEEDSVLDRAIRETYAIRDITESSDFRSLDAASFPTMADLYAVLRNIEGAESLAARLEQYTEGVFSGFLNHQTNVSLGRQMIVFNIRDLESELRPIAMYVILQYIWNEIRVEMKQRLIVVDEAWIMMQNEDAAAFMFGIAKRCRKYFAGLTTITQDVGDFMASRYGKPIVTNSSIQLLLKQSPASIDLIADLFYLTDHEKFLLLESNVGEGIFFAGTKHVAIKVIASYSEDQVITTDPRQLLEIEQAKRDFDAGAGY